MDPEAQAQIDAALADVAKYKKDAKAYKKDVKVLRKANEQMEAEMAEFAELVAKAKADVSRSDTLEARVKELEQQLMTTSSNGAPDADTITKLSEQLAAESAAASNATVANDELTAEVAALKSQISELRTQCEAEKATAATQTNLLEKALETIRERDNALAANEVDLQKHASSLATAEGSMTALQEKLNESERAVDVRLATATVEHETIVQSLKASHDMQTAEIETLRKKNQETEEKLNFQSSSTETALQDAKRQISTLQENLTERDYSLALLQAELQSATNTASAAGNEAREQLAQVEAQVSERDQALKQGQDEALRLQKEHQSSQDRLAVVSSDLHDANDTISGLQQVISEHSTKLKEQRVQIEESEEEIGRLKQRCATVEEAHAREGDAVAVQMTQRVAELESTVSEQISALEKSKAECAALAADVQRLKSECDTAEYEKNIAHESLAKAKNTSKHDAEVAALREKIQELSQARDRAVQEIATVKEQENAADKKYEAALGREKNAASRVVDLESQLNEVQERLTTVTTKFSEVQSVADSARAQATELEKKLAASESLITKFREQSSEELKTEKVRLREKLLALRSEDEARLRAEFATLTSATTAEHEKVVSELQAKIDPNADAQTEETISKLTKALEEAQQSHVRAMSTASTASKAELAKVTEELKQLQEEHAEVSNIYITAQQERDEAVAKAQKFEAVVADLKSAKVLADTECARLETAIVEIEAAKLAAIEEVASAVSARESAEKELQAVQSTFATRFDTAKAEIKAAKAEAKSQRKARQRIETEISELAEAVAIERAQFAEKDKEVENIESRHAAEVQELRESLEVMRQLNQAAQPTMIDIEVQCEEAWPSFSVNDHTTTRAPDVVVDLNSPAAKGGSDSEVGEHASKSPVLEQAAWCSWERASVRRRGRLLEEGGSLVQPTSPSPQRRPPSDKSTNNDPERLTELEQMLAQKDEEIKFLQRALMKNVELAAITKKEENELRREYKTCKNQLDLLVALENEDEEAAAKLRQDIVTAKYRATQAKLTKELKESQQQILDLQEMLMLQRQVRFERARSASPQPQRASAPALRTVRLEREPGRQLGIMLNEDPDGHFKELGVRVAGVRKGSIADESGVVYMGDAIVWINDVWCFKSSFREVINFMKGSGDLVTLKLASAIDIGGCTGDEPFLQSGHNDVVEDEFDGIQQ